MSSHLVGGIVVDLDIDIKEMHDGVGLELFTIPVTLEADRKQTYAQRKSIPCSSHTYTHGGEGNAPNCLPQSPR